LKKIVVLAVVLFGLLLTSMIGVSTAAATQPDWTEKYDAWVITPPEEDPPSHPEGEPRTEIHVPWRAIEKSPAIQLLLVPQYTLTISATAGGTTDPAPGSYVYDEGTEVTVTAIPDEFYEFDHWELDGAVRSENPIDVLMDADHTLHAVFITWD